MNTGLMVGRLAEMIGGDVCAWDHVEPAAPAANPSPTGGGGDPAPQVEAPPVDERPAEAEPEDDPFDPVIATSDGGEDDPRDPVLSHPRVKALRKENRKLLRRVQKLLPVAGAFRGRDVQDVIYRAEAFERLSRAAESNPAIRALLSGQAETPGPTPRRDAAPPEFEDLDPAKVPFNTEDAVGQFLLNEFRTYRQTISDLRSQLTGFTQMFAGNTERQVRTVWKTAVDKASSELPGGVREMFSDAVYGAFREAKERNMNIAPQKVIDHYLGLYKAAAKEKTTQAALASSASAQRMAEHNRTLPRQPAGGTPASVRSGRETVADVNRRLRTFR